MKTTLRQRLLTSTLIGFAGVATPAYAQDDTQDTPSVQAEADLATDAQDPAEGESIVVTGTRIARRDLSSTSPVAVVQDEEFTLSGAVNVEQVINTLPQVIPGTTSFSNNPGGGVATLNLRGLGTQRNLVLVNGRRYIFFDTTQIVDLNTIPQFLIDSVDVVTGGASAVYGSDALVGVVNFRLRQDLDGIVAGGQYSISEEGDGRRYNAYVAIGSQFADGRGHVTAYAEYYNRGQIMQADRAFSFFSLADGAGTTGQTAEFGEAVPGLIAGGSAGVPQGRFIAIGPVSVGAGTNYCSGTAVQCGIAHQTAGAFFASPGVSRPYRPVPLAPNDAYNYAPANYLMVPQERWALGGYAEYEIAEGINAFAEVAFINNRVQNELAATPVTQNVDINIAAVSGLISASDQAQLRTIAARQQQQINTGSAAFGPFVAGTTTFPALATGCVDPDGAGPLLANPATCTAVRLQVNTRTTSIGSRNSFDDRNAFRALVGFRGNLTESLNYEVYYSYARTRNSNIQEGNVSRTAFVRNVANGTCNVFGQDLLSPTCITNISILAQNTDLSQLQVAQASITGPLFTFGTANDPVAFAAGIEWRSMSGQFIPDTALSSGDVVGFNAGQPTAGSYDAKEAFAEIRIPIIQDNFIHRLELHGAARYSDYSLDAVGGVWTYAAGVEFAPIQDISFRGQYQRAIRAPNVFELFGGNAVGFPAATDPCNNAPGPGVNVPGFIATCIATGVPAASVSSGTIQPNAQIQGAFGGNPNLNEEVADSWTAGVVLRPRFIPRLNITVDYYNIEIDGAIAPAGGGVNNILNLCYNQIQDATSGICQLINRDPLGVISGPPFVVNAANVNLSALTTEGIDFSIDYSQPLGFSITGAGESRLSFFFLGTYSWENNFTPLTDLPDDVIECAGHFGLNCDDPTPKWKWSSRLTWIDGPVTSSVRWRHVAATTDDQGGFIVDRIAAYDVFDLAFGFEVNDNLTVNLGINNLFDKGPPIIGSNQEQSNTYPGTFDVIGRDFFVSASLRF